MNEWIQQLEHKGLLRKRTVCNPYSSQLIHFDSNDYLSLTQDKRLSIFYQQGYKTLPTGSGSSMLISGYHEAHRQLEQEFANFLNVDECVLFSSGYAANLAITSLLGKLESDCLIDKAVHASIYDGLNGVHANYLRFLPNNMDDLNRKMSTDLQNPALITEGIFSMNGQIAQLDIISELCIAKEVALLVDEAHSFGILGENGRGVVDYYKLNQDKVPLRVIPLGKGFAGQGALVAGRKEWINALLQAGRSLIYSTAISPALCYGLLKTLNVISEADDRRLKLFELVKYFKQCIQDSAMNWIDSNTPIQFVQLGCPHKALYYSKELEKQGIKCSAIRSPTVSPKATGLRIVINYNHQEKHIKQLVNSLSTLYEHSNR